MLRPVQTPGPSAPAALWPKGQLPHNTQQTWVCQRLKVKAPEHCSSTTGSSGSRSRFLLCRRMWPSFKIHVLTGNMYRRNHTILPGQSNHEAYDASVCQCQG